MRSLLDSSVLVAALVFGQPHHAVCAPVLDQGELFVYTHGIAETFAFLTGGRVSPRPLPGTAAQLIDRGVLPFVEIVSLLPREILAAIGQTESRGIRGGAIYDYLHLVAARKAKAQRIYTLNIRHFQSFHRSGDPEIVHP